MNFIKRNKGIIIAIGIFIIFLVLLVQVKTILFPDERKPIYGNRLDGIVEISSSDQKKITDSISGETSSAEVRIAGKTVNIHITVNNETSVDNAKKTAQKALDTLSNKQKEQYDVQIFIAKKEESNEFPIIGYKHHKKTAITWTKDRTGN